MPHRSFRRKTVFAGTAGARQIPGSRLEVFGEDEGGSHFPFVENPATFNRLVADFIGCTPEDGRGGSMTDLEALREGVRTSLPELAEIRNADLREKVVEAWAMALAESEFARIDDIPPTGVPGSPAMRRGTQADHFRGVARMAIALADGLEQVIGPLGIDRDELLAAALCHDVGKPFEFSPRNLERWRANPAAAGNPAIRHPVYGVHIALRAGLPEAVVHAVGAHSLLAEGSFVVPSLSNVIVQYADIAFWKILERAGLLEQPE